MSKSFRAVVVGAGGISNAWFGPLKKEEVEVAAVVDLRKEAAEGKIAKHELAAKPFTDMGEALAFAKPDFVVDLTVPAAHCQVTCQALEAGCPVVSEKPMANSMDEARKMVATSEKTGNLYMVSQSRRWIAQHQQLRDTIRNGAIGQITTINCDFYIGAHFGGFRDVMPSPLILDMAIHHFDLVRFFCDLDASWVYAVEYNPHGSWYKGDVAATCIFHMNNGAIFTYRGSWCAEGCSTSWNGDWRIVGDKGTLLYEKDALPHGEIVTGSDGFSREKQPITIAPPTVEFGGMHGALREMLHYLRTGEKPQTECHDNIKSLAMVFGSIDSSHEKQRIDINI